MSGTTSPTDAERRPLARNDRILWRQTDGCAILFHEDTGRAFALNETGAAVWALLDGARSVVELVRALAAKRNLSEADATLAVARVLEELDGFGCLGPHGVRPAREAAAGSPPPADATGTAYVEEVVFGGCDCTGSGRGVMRNAECTTPAVKVQTSAV